MSASLRPGAAPAAPARAPLSDSLVARIAARFARQFPVRRATLQRPQRWLQPLLPALLALGAVVTVLLLFHATVYGMLALWSRSATFAHGFAVVPAAAWLAWRLRTPLQQALARPSTAPLRQRLAGPLLMLPLGLAWLLASLVQVQVVMDYALVLMLAATVIGTLGWPATRVLAFPLAYLLLAVPFGEVLIPPLIDFTANFTVTALQLSGIPVYREQQMLSIPSGDWSVEAACSGLRYLIASFALGALYAYLSFRSLWRRLLFIGVALLLPLLANGVRAYGIVLLGHLSNMRLAVGVDHLVYGWLFFGLVCLLLFWCGSFWHEPTAPAEPAAATLARSADAMTIITPIPPIRAAVVGAIVCVGVAACWPWLSTMVQQRQPDGVGTTGQLLPAYPSRDGAVQLRVVPNGRQPDDQGPDEAVLSAPDWRLSELGGATLRIDGHALPVRRTIARRDGARLLVWRWYRQSGVDTTSPALVKLLLATSRLTLSPDDGVEFIVSTPLAPGDNGDDAGTGQNAASASPDAASARLRRFLTDQWPSLYREQRHVAGR